MTIVHVTMATDNGSSMNSIKVLSTFGGCFLVNVRLKMKFN